MAKKDNADETSNNQRAGESALSADFDFVEAGDLTIVRAAC